MILAEEKCDIRYMDSSGLNCVSRCPARFYFERCIGLRLPDSNMINPDYGTCIHAALPFAYDDVNKAHKVFQREWKKMGYGEDDPKMNSERALAMLEDFHSLRRSDSPASPYVPLEPPGGRLEVEGKYSDAEVPFLMDIGARYPFIGRIDRLVRLKADGKTWPLDYKTSSEVSARIVGNFNVSLQCISYTIAASKFLNARAPGMLLEFLRKSARNTETLLAPVFVTDRWRERFVSYAIEQAENIYKYNEEQLWPQRLTGCAPYGMFHSPGFQCEYLKLCNLPDWTAGRRWYKEEIWHPFEVLETERVKL